MALRGDGKKKVISSTKSPSFAASVSAVTAFIDQADQLWVDGHIVV
jgi:hypothetical protein